MPASFRRLAFALSASSALLWTALWISSGLGGRGFFSPDTLEYRSQSERTVFATEIPLYRSAFRYDSHELVNYLVEKGYWSPRPASEPRWIFLFHWNRNWKDGESCFHRSFFWRKDFWMEWTEKHPERAAEVWPQVLELLRAGRDAEVARLLVDIQYES
ncbi:MAG: hypothetical protein HS116_14140 [Planctomycetes bacterium]|nr:hypothetical protein [Planctomycetota bacterium]